MYEVIDMYSKYDNMHKKGNFYADICITNHIITYYQLSLKIIYFEIINFKLDRMINMHSKYDSMHRIGIFYALICINNHVIKKYKLHGIMYPPILINLIRVSL